PTNGGGSDGGGRRNGGGVDAVGQDRIGSRGGFHKLMAALRDKCGEPILHRRVRRQDGDAKAVWDPGRRDAHLDGRMPTVTAIERALPARIRRSSTCFPTESGPRCCASAVALVTLAPAIVTRISPACRFARAAGPS